MTRRLSRTPAGDKPAVRLDDNVGSYDVLRDGRSGEGRIQQVRLDHIEASPFQVRRVFPEREVEELAESIRANGLIHEPKARPHPSRPGWIELMPGEMRVRALKRLVELGQADGVLTRDFEGNWLVPVKVESLDDEHAERIVLSENMDRTDLSAWEWALAWQQRRESLRRREQPATVRDVAASLGKKYQTVGEYLQVADGVTPEVLMAAGVVSGGDADHHRLSKLSLAALLRVARKAAASPAGAADLLLHELKRVGDQTAGAQLVEQRRRSSRLQRPERSGFQINIRQPLGELSPSQAANYLERIAPAVGILAERAAPELGDDATEALARELEAAASRLRRRDA